MNGCLAGAGSGVRVLVRKWESLQVELHGSYSIQRFQSVFKYRESTGISRALLMLAAIPLLPLACVAIIDALPMNSPDLGLANSGTVWIRGVSVGLLTSFTLSWMFCRYVPELEVSRRTLLFTTIAATAVSHIAVFCLILLFSYPLPFTLIWMSGPWIGTLALSLRLARGDFLRRNPGVRQEVRRFSILLVMHTSTALVIAGFNLMFLSVPNEWQALVALLVPAFKITERNLFCLLLRGKDDLKPELVIFTVEITNALFISTSMQNAASTNTSTMLILIDFVQLLISLCDLRLMLNSVKGIADKMGIGTHEIVASAFIIATKYPELGKETSLSDTASQSKSDVFRLSTLQRIKLSTFQVGRKLTSTTQVAPTPANLNMGVVPNGLPVKRNSVGPTPDDLELLERITPRERQLLLRKALQIVFLTEFLLLNELMEVVTPVMYSCNLAIIYCWPNREYYSLFKGLDDTDFRRVIRNILLYGLLEQLAYALRSSWGKIQCKLVIWLLLLLQSAIPQLELSAQLFGGTGKRIDAASIDAALKPSAPGKGKQFAGKTYKQRLEEFVDKKVNEAIEAAAVKGVSRDAFIKSDPKILKVEGLVQLLGDLATLGARDDKKSSSDSGKEDGSENEGLAVVSLVDGSGVANKERDWTVANEALETSDSAEDGNSA
ncbi:Haloacid dehalogenase-like hydrolase domain-containing protein 3 [Phytophthora pseudosyringae]|uniref:Haloacid dehalogenase-like hydrolase domain-containing protein 3 n=1 Tax=Phytophthora pseudosyringae TaxID=221518 RepID=A0A8T1WAL2_9STRA|nr:Haloacid dehalogenase-like hydrolase domain-containing protein 3 [Phytophthora pseudosyringae]